MSTDSSPEDTIIVPSPVSAADAPALRRLGEWRLLRKLGEGGMGVVFEARHAGSGHRVALKTLPRMDGDALHKFKREFRTASELNHPNLIGLQQLQEDGGQWFFTMDLIEGCTFLQHVRPHGVLDEQRLREALKQLTDAVIAIHGQQIIHRDLKPSNIMVGEDGRVVVLDFGLVLDKKSATVTQNEYAGTPPYMAPEQFGSTVSAAADWYAVGAILFESLSGERAYKSDNFAKILHDKLYLPSPLPPNSAPADLRDLCSALLAKEPGERPTAFEMASAFATTVPMDSVLTHPKQRLLGRSTQISVLEEALVKFSTSREPARIFLSGHSGEGKTTLAEHFLAPLRKDTRFAVMTGRCYDRESVPFKAIDSLIDSLASFLRSVPDAEANALIPDDVSVLTRVFPVLQRVEAVARASDPHSPQLDDQQTRMRAFTALRSMLKRISRKSLVIWFVDDLQWGDPDSAEALAKILAPPDAPSLLFVGSFRSDEADGSAFLARWASVESEELASVETCDVRVAPLSVEECIQFVVEETANDSETIRRRALEFAKEARGNPFLLTELLSCFDAASDSFEPVPLSELISRKLARLPDDAKNLLEVIAVFGKAMSLEEATEAIGSTGSQIATVTRMRNERLLRLLGSEDAPVVDTYHDRVRETTLSMLTPSRRQEFHLAIADCIEQRFGRIDRPSLDRVAHERVYDLAYHFDSAKVPTRALPCAIAAAERARTQLALDVAREQYEVAERNADTNSPLQFRIAIGRGDTLMRLGDYAAAIEVLEKVVNRDDRLEAAEVELLMASTHYRRGTLGDSIFYAESALRRLGVRVPRSSIGRWAGILRQSMVQLGHTIYPRRLHKKELTRTSELSLRLLHEVSRVSVFTSTPTTLWSILRQLNLAELLPKTSELSYAYAAHGLFVSMSGFTKRGARYCDRAKEVAQALDDVGAVGQGAMYAGISAFVRARFDDSIRNLDEAVGFFERVGDRWHSNMARFHRAYCHFCLGEIQQSIDLSGEVIDAAARIGDSRVFCSTYLWARATKGNLPFNALSALFPSRPDDVMSTVHGVMAEGHWHAHHGRSEDSLSSFQRAARMVRQSGCINMHMILVLPELSAALRRRANEIVDDNPEEAISMIKQSRRMAKWGSRLCRLFPVCYPHALRERAESLADSGRIRRAVKFAKRSAAVAEQQGAVYQWAHSRLTYGRLAKQLGIPDCDQEIEAGELALEEMGAKSMMSV